MRKLALTITGVLLAVQLVSCSLEPVPETATENRAVVTHAAAGEELWCYDPKLDRHRMCYSCRGAATCNFGDSLLI